MVKFNCLHGILVHCEQDTCGLTILEPILHLRAMIGLAAIYFSHRPWFESAMRPQW